MHPVPNKILSGGLICLIMFTAAAGRSAAFTKGGSPLSRPIAVYSPDGDLALRFYMTDSSRGTPTVFEVAFRDKRLLRGRLGLCVSGVNLFDKLTLESSHREEHNNIYTMPLGKNNPIVNHYRELTLQFEPEAGPLRKLDVVFRVYNDGVAYRYILPEEKGLDSVAITDEPGTFRFYGDPSIWPLYLRNYTTSHEAIYDSTSFSQLDTNRLIDVPLLAEYSDGVSVSFVEANLHNYAGLYLRAGEEGTHKYLRCDLSPLPDDFGVMVRSNLPLSSPWRAFIIGRSPGQLIESNLILNLNRPNAIGKASWLKAGKTSFYWWNGIQEPENTEKAFRWEEKYIDFCAENGIQFHAVIGTEENHPWYYQTGNGYNPPGRDADVTRPRPGFHMAQLVKYARSKGVGIRVWVNWKPLSKHLEAAFAQYQKWGLSGVMVDFLNRNDQEMVNFVNKVVKVAAEHHLDVNFHGIWAPTGLSRTYPNLFNYEGVLNLEYLKWSDRCTPRHDVTVPFTRMVAGPMDYHLGGFRGSYRSEFKHRSVRPIIMGTRCHQLAMYVVFENPLPMVCDVPDSYIGQPGFDFLREVPTTWDETRVPIGKVGEYIVVARRKGRDWYIGAMTNWTARSVSVPLSFLHSGGYRVEIWADADTSQGPNALIRKKVGMTAKDTLRMQLNSGGGEVVRITPLHNSFVR